VTNLTMHGIANCDTIKKAKKWLNEANVDFQFRDYKKQPPSLAELESWSNLVGWETLLNKRGTTWRKLDPALQENLDQAKALPLLVDNPSMIKRPLLIKDGGRALVGFKVADYEEFNA